MRRRYIDKDTKTEAAILKKKAEKELSSLQRFKKDNPTISTIIAILSKIVSVLTIISMAIAVPLSLMFLLTKLGRALIVVVGRTPAGFALKSSIYSIATAIVAFATWHLSNELKK